MEKLAVKIAGRLISRGYVDESMRDIYQYGLQRLLEIGGAFLSSIVICVCFEMWLEGLTFFLFFIPLRSFLGGIHLEKYWECYLLSCGALVVLLLIVKYIKINAFVMCAIIFIALLGIYGEARREKKLQQTNFFYKVICWVLGGVTLVTCVCAMQGYNSILATLCCTMVLVLVSKLLERYF